MTINIPALRERGGDALLLAQSFLRRFAEEHGRAIRGLSEDAVAAVQSYAWPGNARELENRVKRAVIMADGALVTAEDLELEDIESQEFPFNLRQVREEAEIQAIKRALVFSDNKVAQAAELLGVTT